MAIDIAMIGNPCSGAYGDLNLVMPSGTAPAIDGSHPVRCFEKWPGHTTYNQDTSSDCPQSLPLVNLPNNQQGYSIDPKNVNPPFWPLAYLWEDSQPATYIEIQVPVKSTSALNGSQPLEGYVQLADGYDNPTLQPSLGMIVDPAAVQSTQQIGILYSNPPISSQSVQTNSSVNVNFTSYVENYSNPGSAVAQLAKADPAGDCTSPATFPASSPSFPNGYYTSNSTALHSPNTQITGTFTSLYGGGAYCFRIVATVSSGPQAGTYYGNWTVLRHDWVVSDRDEQRLSAAAGAPPDRHWLPVERFRLLELGVRNEHHHRLDDLRGRRVDVCR